MLSLCMQCENVACRAVNWQCCVSRWSKDICERITTFLRNNTVAFALFHLFCYQFLDFLQAWRSLELQGNIVFLWGRLKGKVISSSGITTTSQTEDVPGKKKKKSANTRLFVLNVLVYHALCISFHPKVTCEKASRVPLPHCNSTLIPSGGVFPGRRFNTLPV